MADDADRASIDAERLEQSTIDAARARASLIPAGVPGDCELCGEHFQRLVRNACARCRDKYKLP